MASPDPLLHNETRVPVSSQADYSWTPQPCPTCEVPPTQLLGRRGGRAHREGRGVECEVWRCGRCGLIFPHPMPRPINGLAQHYAVEADDYFQQHDTGKKEEAALLLLREARELTGGGRLLDIGSGRGEMLSAAVKSGWEAVGIETSPTFAEHAARRSGAEVRREPLEQCAFEPHSFDVVILAAVLEHLYNPDETIRVIARILRPGGALFVDVPNEEGLYFRVGNLYERLKGRDWVVNLAPTFEPFHVFGFGPRSLRTLLAKHGLRPERWRIYGDGLAGTVERHAARAITALSNFGSLGTYIETWAVKR
jgi:2-polyprenyl-3-methyl-5-hydroxy-6-metoxy-1,4-benzoquinol methylase